MLHIRIGVTCLNQNIHIVDKGNNILKKRQHNYKNIVDVTSLAAKEVDTHFKLAIYCHPRFTPGYCVINLLNT